MHTVSVARQAMATRFEIVLHGDNPVSLRAAGEEALEEIERIEDRLSLFRPTSEIAHVNARAAREPVRVSPATFRLIEHAVRLGAETGGAFDVTIGPLMRCWGFIDGTGHMPSPGAIAEARAHVGLHLVELNPGAFTLRFARDGVMLDLGAIGKGYAVGVAAEILREAGVGSALIHGGTSSVFAIGRPPDAEAWKVAIERPPVESRTGVPPGPPMPVPPANSTPPAHEAERRAPARRKCDSRQRAEQGLGAPSALQARHDRTGDSLLAVVPLRDEALSISAVWGKSFQTGGNTFGHVIDPRTGEPTGRAVLAAVVLPSTTETDALSTALLTLGPPGLDLLARLRPRSRLLVAGMRGDEVVAEGRGIEPGCLGAPVSGPARR